MAIDISSIIALLSSIVVLSAVVAAFAAVGCIYAQARGDELVRSDLRRVRSVWDDFAFRRRYARECRERDYQAWKKRKGY